MGSTKWTYRKELLNSALQSFIVQLRVQMCIKDDSSNRQKMNCSYSSMAKCEFVFSSHTKTLIRRSFILKPIEKTEVPLKNGVGFFKIDPRLRDWHIVM